VSAAHCRDRRSAYGITPGQRWARRHT
jgi:hypothetical protein